MCITVASARLNNTKLYVGEGVRNDELVHVVAYQNTAHNNSDEPNAMILPFPTAKEMTDKNVIDTRSFSKFLDNISDASKMRTLGFDGADSRNMTKGASRGFAQVFKSGSYTVILAENVDQIPEALTRVDKSVRPRMSAEFLYGYGQLYKDQPVAICCWNGVVKAEPLLWWYTPKNADHLFAPTMDAHDGDAPRLSDAVEMDHIISVGSTTDRYQNTQNKVLYRDTIPEDVKSLLPTYVYGTRLNSTYANGDMFLGTEDLNKKFSNYKDIPKMKRGVSFAEASIQSRDFELFGWH